MYKEFAAEAVVWLVPIVVLIGRPQDAWLGTWSRAEATVPHPLDPFELARTVVGLLRPVNVGA